jgi:CheY-like chemotaxis protein
VPLAIDHEDLAPSQNALTDWPQHPLHILLSDSRLDTLFILRNLLQHEHIRVTSTHELSETLALAVGDLPDVVLLDTSVTAGDSYRVLSALQAHPQTQHIPVIAVTASAMKGDREQLLALGYRGYVAKPCTRRTLLQSIHDALA